MLERPPAVVTTATAQAADVPVYLDEIGSIVTMELVSIVPQVGGKIMAVHIDDGAYVKRGQLLYEIDARPYQAALDQAQAALLQSKAQLTFAESDFARVRDLPPSVVSRQDFDQKKNAVSVAEAQVAASQAAIEMAKLNLEYTKIYSPLDGRAGVVLTVAGNVVKANDAPMLVIQQLDPIYAEFTITENDLGTVRKHLFAEGLDLSEAAENLKIEVDVPGDSPRIMAALSASAPATRPATAGPGPREGKVTFLDNSVNRNTGRVRLRATLVNSDHYLWPGQFVKVRLVLETKKDAVLIPSAAQQLGQEGPYVYVVKPDSTAELRLITVGQRQGDLIVVESGLRSGEQVVMTGHMSVMPNGKVVVANAPPAASQPGTPEKANAIAGK
jgi:membrane fusion protein, multidrug efflux system